MLTDMFRLPNKMKLERMKTFKKVLQGLLLLSLLFILKSCIADSYPVEYHCVVENLTDKVVTIEALLAYKYTDDRERSFTIEAGASVTVITENGFRFSPWDDPKDKYNLRDDKIPVYFEKFDIYVDGVLMPEKMRWHENWNFKAKKTQATYTLRITEALISKVTMQ
jgi:hypothetical protein